MIRFEGAVSEEDCKNFKITEYLDHLSSLPYISSKEIRLEKRKEKANTWTLHSPNILICDEIALSTYQKILGIKIISIIDLKYYLIVTQSKINNEMIDRQVESAIDNPQFYRSPNTSSILANEAAYQLFLDNRNFFKGIEMKPATRI
ncbi:hypothetical protein [Deinococcus ruber]|uniref:hypothetical protein n=1 Tax=Deinococcus ruber TaxID=1848197 RepID=UPI00166CBF49|nr:hypothetical protein [Deinococcus ruber]